MSLLKPIDQLAPCDTGRAPNRLARPNRWQYGPLTRSFRAARDRVRASERCFARSALTMATSSGGMAARNGPPASRARSTGPAPGLPVRCPGARRWAAARGGTAGGASLVGGTAAGAGDRGVAHRRRVGPHVCGPRLTDHHCAWRPRASHPHNAGIVGPRRRGI